MTNQKSLEETSLSGKVEKEVIKIFHLLHQVSLVTTVAWLEAAASGGGPPPKVILKNLGNPVMNMTHSREIFCQTLQPLLL